MTSLTKQAGAAIIVALFVTALVAIAAVAMIERLRIDLYRTNLLFNDNRGSLYAEGSIAWAKEQLNKNWREKKPNKIVDETPISSPEDTIDDVTIRTSIFDQEGLFNLNNLTNGEYMADFARLIRIVAPETTTETAKDLSLAVRDWISPGAIKTSFDEFYFKQNPPYRAPHRLMVSVSELRLVKGMTADLYNALAPYVTALPEITKINVNNAPWAVIMSLNPTMTRESANAIEKKRKNSPFQTTQLFLQEDVVKNNAVPEAKISVTSSYFLVKTNVKVLNQETIRYTLLHRVLKNSQPYEVILWQSKGTL